jgi:hypothetical protein
MLKSEITMLLEHTSDVSFMWYNADQEFTSMMQPLPSSIVDDWTHEGPDDPDADRLALAEAMSELEHYRTHPQDAMDWESFKAQLQHDVGGMT